MNCDYSLRIQFIVAQSNGAKFAELRSSKQPSPPLSLSVWIFQQQMADGETSNTFIFSVLYFNKTVS